MRQRWRRDPRTGLIVPADLGGGIVRAHSYRVGADAGRGGPALAAAGGGGGGGFVTPDIINNVSYESGFNGMCNGGFTAPGPFTVRDNARAFVGAWSVKRTIPTVNGNDDGGIDAPFYAGSPLAAWTPNPAVPAVQVDRLWTRFYFFIDAATDASHKFHQIYSASYSPPQFGGLQLKDGFLLIIGTPEDNGTGAGAVSVGATADAYLRSTASLNDGNWHWLELDYWRNGDTSNGGNDYPSMLVTLDGAPLNAFLNGPPHAPAVWIGNRINFGMRSSSVQIAIAHWLGVVNNGATIGANIWIDRVAVSKAGPIGP